MSATKKVVINACYGGFGLSNEAERRYAAAKGLHIIESESFGRTWLHMATSPDADPNNVEDNAKFVSITSADRADPALVSIVEEMGNKADGMCADLRVVEIPADVEYEIEEYDGREHVAEAHRTWY